MASKLACILIYFIALWPCRSQAQTPETTGWFFLSHTQKVAKRWDILFDGQLRSAHRLLHVNTLLLRSAVNYNFNKNHSAALGYAFKGDWEHDGKSAKYQPENRVYEQYLYSTKLLKAELTGRFRLEQRFVREEDKYQFSQRARGFVALQIPLFANQDFSRGTYLNLQNELFVNVDHKDRVNNAFFDQNRLLGSAGYRLSKKMDAELGLMLWRQLEEDGYNTTHVVQLMITTSL